MAQYSNNGHCKRYPPHGNKVIGNQWHADWVIMEEWEMCGEYKKGDPK